jgi:hypothetical protein
MIESPKWRVSLQTYEVERIVSGPRLADGMYLIKCYTDSDNTWEPRSHLPDSVFEDDAGTLSCLFEVIATKTVLSSAAALARHKLTIKPKPRTGQLSSESNSPDVDSSKDEWTPSSGDTVVDVEEESGGETTEGYGGASPPPESRFEIQARSSPRTSPSVFTIDDIKQTIEQWLIRVVKLSPFAIWDFHYISDMARRSEIRLD